MFLDIFSIPINYFRTIAQTPAIADPTKYIMLYSINDYNCIIKFLDNIVIIQENRIVVSDASTPLRASIPCTNTSRYIELDQTSSKFTLWCGLDEQVWQDIMNNLNPELFEIKSFLAWKASAYPDDDRLLVQHVVNYMYSLGKFRLDKAKRRAVYRTF